VTGAVTDVVVGVDVGATKLAVRVESVSGAVLTDRVLPADDWAAEPADRAAAWLRDRLPVPAGATVRALGVGAQGGDSAEVRDELRAALARLGFPATVVNDAALLVPAAGATAGIGVIAGTGAIAVGADASGTAIAAGGWGWVLGDDAGGAGIVRDAVKAALFAHDAGEPDDGLLAALRTAYGVPTAERLARAVNDEPTVPNWAPHAPAVFAAADAGSALAAGIVDGAGEHLAVLVDQLVARGAVGDTVVAAGGVLVGAPRLYEALQARLATRQPHLRLVLLTEPPVVGAVALARRLLAGDRREEDR
jgi:N-acetylglucosamine kinase-like BadF-type ATPase